jgi:hypothetical protein
MVADHHGRKPQGAPMNVDQPDCSSGAAPQPELLVGRVQLRPLIVSAALGLGEGLDYVAGDARHRFRSDRSKLDLTIMDADERRAFHAEMKARHYAEQRAVPDEELTLTAREFDNILRWEFAARELRMQELIDAKVREVLVRVDRIPTQPRGAGRGTGNQPTS